MKISNIKSILLSVLIVAGLSPVLVAAQEVAANGDEHEASQHAQVDINSADAERLATGLQGVGATRAAAIVAYRQEHGAFKSIDELLLVKGIGESTLETNRAVLTIGSQ